MQNTSNTPLESEKKSSIILHRMFLALIFTGILYITVMPSIPLSSSAIPRATKDELKFSLSF